MHPDRRLRSACTPDQVHARASASKIAITSQCSPDHLEITCRLRPSPYPPPAKQLHARARTPERRFQGVCSPRTRCMHPDRRLRSACTPDQPDQVHARANASIVAITCHRGPRHHRRSCMQLHVPSVSAFEMLAAFVSSACTPTGDYEVHAPLISRTRCMHVQMRL